MPPVTARASSGPISTSLSRAVCSTSSIRTDPIRVSTARMGGSIHVGTSSWADPGFVEEWYPPKLPARDRLPWYAERFDTVEVNSTFYALPEPRTVATWVRVTPPDFVFDVKAHKLLSRHAASVDSLPPGLRDMARTTPRGRVQLTPELEEKMTDELIATV